MPRHGIGVARARLQALGHRLQERVADRMAECVVDGFEAIEIDTKHRDLPVSLAALGQRLFELLAKLHAVGHSRERIVTRHVRDPRLGGLALRDVLESLDPSADHGLVRDGDRSSFADRVMESDGLADGEIGAERVVNLICRARGMVADGDAVLEKVPERNPRFDDVG